MGKTIRKEIFMNCMFVLLGLVSIFFANAPVEAATITDAKKYTPASEFEFDSTTGMITKYIGTSVEVVIPNKINNMDVKGLVGAFDGNETVNTIVIPDNLTTFGDLTFNGCKELKNIAVYRLGSTGEIPSEIDNNELKNYVYDGTNGYKVECTNWGEAGIPSSVTLLGTQAFGGKNQISKFIVMEGNTSYTTTEDGVCLLSFDKTNLYRFASGYTCNSGYTLPEGLISIGQYAFEEIHNDGPLQFPVSIQVISDYGFYKYGMIDNNFVFPEDCQLHTIGSNAFTYNRKLQIKFPKSLKTIGSRSFSFNENVAIDISETQIETIPAYGFAECSALHTLTMPATLKHIEAYAFTECNNLSTVTFLGDTLETLGEGAFKNSPTLHYITIPEGVKNIENETFNGCGNLGEVVLPDSVTTIGDNAFKDCVTIHKLVIPPNVNYISNSSFEGVKQTNIDTSKNAYSQTIIKGELVKKGYEKVIGNLKYKVTKSDATKGTVTVLKPKSKKLKSVTIPAVVNINGYTFKVTAIANNAFKSNTKLTKITIGQNVKTIGSNAFLKCKKLKTITLKSTVVSKVNKNAFKGIHKKAKIKLPKMSSKKFKSYKKKFLKKGQALTVKIVK